MPQQHMASVILAAGLGTRMKSSLPKVLHPLAGRPMLSYPLELALSISTVPACVVIPPRQPEIQTFLAGKQVRTAVQSKQLGTAHALLAAERSLSQFKGYVVVLSGDVPLIRRETLQAFVDETVLRHGTVGFITMQLSSPGQYGRVVRDKGGSVVRIVEAKNAGPGEKDICEVNAGVYCVEREWLFRALKRIRSNAVTREFYLTDILSLAVADNRNVVPYKAQDPDEFLGVNTRVDLARVATILRGRINRDHMLNGVTMLDEAQAYIDTDVEIGADTTVFPGSFLLGTSSVGMRCIIEPGVVLRDAVLSDDVHVKAMSVIESSSVLQGAVIGPFARIRPGSKVGRAAKVGNFVEIKQCELKDGAKASHLTYLGDAVVGANANIGCGTITCNYDGHSKHRTIIGEGVFIGSDTQLVAPVNVGRGATIGAGSTITKDVPPQTLALSRVPQVLVKGWKPKWLRSKRKA